MKTHQYLLLTILLLSWSHHPHLVQSSADPSTANDDASDPKQSEGYRIAIIGGGISGTFTAKYLAEYDVKHLGSATANKRDCLLDEIVVYDVSPPPVGFSENDDLKRQHPNSEKVDITKLQSSSDPRPNQFQGSRVASLTLKDGRVIELGGSIVYNGNKLVVGMVEGDPDRLKKGLPLGLGNKTIDEKNDGSKEKVEESTSTERKERKSAGGFGIYHGQKEWLIKPSSFPQYLPSFLKPIWSKLYFLWRYNFDLFRLKSAVERAVHAFDVIYELLDDTQNEVTYFESPMDMWEAIGLRSAAGISFHDLLDGLGLTRDERLELEKGGGAHSRENGDGGWWNWRRWVPGMGCLRSELVTAMTINTYNQDLNQMNGLVGLVAYVPVGGELFSIEGGNHKLMESALHQAKGLYHNSSCNDSSSPRIKVQQKQITSVVSGEDVMELYSKEESLGRFDIVVLAAPLQQCRIQFLIQSPMGMDPSVLHPMPLGGVHDNPDPIDGVQSNTSNEHGDKSFATPVPPSAKAPYTSVVTTIISNVTLNASHFGLDENESLPRSILVSERGKLLEGITTLTILSVDEGLVKTFSSEILTPDKLIVLFGQNHVVEYVQVWGGGDSIEGGIYGGATPNFGGGAHSESLSYLLYDGAKHWGKNGVDGTVSGGPALYYVNAIESAVAAIEISAIGAKSTAKLIAHRLGLVRPQRTSVIHEEL